MFPDTYNRAELYPHTHMLSSTQVLDYEKSPEDFFIEWVLGAARPKNAAMEFGTLVSLKFAQQISDKELAARLTALSPKRLHTLLHDIVAALPKIPPQFCERPFLVKHKGWTFRITPDACIPEQYTIIENKTGQAEWTQERVNFSDQLTLQAWGFWKTHGVPPKRILLNWGSTKAGAPKVIQSFRTTRSLTALKNMERRVEAVIAGIEAGNFSRQIYN